MRLVAVEAVAPEGTIPTVALEHGANGLDDQANHALCEVLARGAYNCVLESLLEVPLVFREAMRVQRLQQPCCLAI